MGTIIERKGKKGVSYFAQIRRHGRFLKNQSDSLSKTFKTYREANEWIKKTESDIREKEPRPFTSKYDLRPQDITLENFCIRYEKQVQAFKEPTTRVTQRVLLQWWKDHIGHLPLPVISTSIINDHIILLMQTKQPSTIKRYIGALSCIMKFAVKEKLLERNPLTGMSKPKIPKPKVRFLDDDERRQLLLTAKNDMNPHIYPALILSLDIGLRLGSLKNLTWGDVQVQRKRVTLYRTKNDESYTIPISDFCLKTLLEYRDSLPEWQKGDYVFKAKSGNSAYLRRCWDRIRRNSGVRLRWHDLRHSTASDILMSGGSLAHVKETLGHKSWIATTFYAHLNEQAVRDAVNNAAKKFVI
jgi:integrase